MQNQHEAIRAALDQLLSKEHAGFLSLGDATVSLSLNFQTEDKAAAEETDSEFAFRSRTVHALIVPTTEGDWIIDEVSRTVLDYNAEGTMT